MPGDRFPIDSVVHGEYMKWSIVEARVGSGESLESLGAMDEGTASIWSGVGMEDLPHFLVL